MADPETGFHILPGSTPHSAAHPINMEPDLPLPEDLPNVAAAKAKHAALFDQIRRDHAANAGRESAAVSAKRAEHAEAFDRIAAEHARIAAEHAKLAEAAEAEAARQRAFEEQQQQFRQQQHQ